MKDLTTFSDKEVNFFKDMIGKQFEKFKCDSFIYSPMVYGIIGCYIGGKVYKITATCESVTRFFDSDELSVFRIEQASDEDIKSFMDDGELIETPISSEIVSIDIVTDHQELEHDGETQSLDYSIGIVFHFEDTREISFEIKTWFSEMITIEKGYNLVEKFKSLDDFIEEWDGCDGYTAKCSRHIDSIQ